MQDPRTSVGTRIRDLRIARGMSLSELARESRVAKATLSNIEAGEANPTLDTLWHLSVALRVPLGGFFGEVRRDVSVVRAADMKPVKSPALDGFLVSMFDVEAARIEMFRGTLKPGAVHESPAHQPGVIEHIIVHQGRMRLGPRGKELVLDPGDYLRMEGQHPHSYEALSDNLMVTIVMQYPHDSESLRILGKDKPLDMPEV